MTSGETTWTYTYNADGLRTKRTDGTNTYEYVYYGGLLQYMEYNNAPVYFTHRILDAVNDTVHSGLAINGGVGTEGKEVHVEWGETFPIPWLKINIFDAFDTFCETVEGW